MADAIEAPAQQDKPTEDHYRALLAERGWPPIKGGSPELDEETGSESNTPEAPDNGQAGGGEEESFIDSFDLDAVPEDARPHVEALQKQWQGSYTQKRQADKQEIAEARREAEQAQQIQAALRNPQVAPAVLAQLGYTEKQVLEMYGYQPEEDETDEFADPDERIGRLEQTLAQRDAVEQAQRQEAAVTDYIAEQIEALETKAGQEFEPSAHQLLDAYARQYAKNGVPDVEGAYQLLSGLSKAEQKALLDPKRNTPRPPGGGKPASRTVDLSKESSEERRERMAQAVEASQASQA